MLFLPGEHCFLLFLPGKHCFLQLFCCCYSSLQGLWHNVEVQLFSEERGNFPPTFPWSKRLPEWECYGSASVLKVCSFPGLEQATWESIGILVSTLSWSYFLWLELHPYAGALSGLGLVCSKPWVLSAGAVLGRLSSSCQESVHLPSALVPGCLRQ